MPTAPAASMLTRPIPRTGEALPVIGLGTAKTFDVGPSGQKPLLDVLEVFFRGGGRLIDSSPMYGRAEAVIGELLPRRAEPQPAFLATKVWTTGMSRGQTQMRESLAKLGSERIDLMQIHNLVDWRTHLPTLREWKQAGTFRYIGITHYQHSAFAEIETILRSEQIDFVQLPYSLQDRLAEQRLLPAAKDTGTAVLVMEPFASGELFQTFGSRPLPVWAADIDCSSWAQIFLKFILGHPAVNCPIPATSKPQHMADNLQAGFGRLPDESLRQRMVADLFG